MAGVQGQGEADTDLAVDETSPLETGSPYAQTKLVVERMLADTAASDPLRVRSPSAGRRPARQSGVGGNPPDGSA